MRLDRYDLISDGDGNVYVLCTLCEDRLPDVETVSGALAEAVSHERSEHGRGTR